MTLWYAEDAAKAVGAAVTGDWHARRVVTDSRKVEPGDLFVALSGERFDGGAFVAEALEKGAVASIVPQDFADDSIFETQLLRVPDTLIALQALGRAGRDRSAARIVGVTGSVGKTSCKEALALVCGDQARTYASLGNLNNHIGLPLMLANLPADTEIAVIEMGMNHAGEIALLSKMARPDVGIITAVEAVHLEFFPDVAAIADAKAEICAGMPASGVLVIPADNLYASRLLKRAEFYGVTTIRSYGSDARADVWLASYRVQRDGSEILLAGAHGERSGRLGTIGRHWAVMAAGVIAVTDALGLDAERAMESLAKFREPAGRGRTSETKTMRGSILILDDSYNASPASMRAAFARLAEIRGLRGGRAIAALGDMRELGDHAPSLHAELAELLVLLKIDRVHAAGPLMRHLYDALPEAMRGRYAADSTALAEGFAAELEEGDVLLVKGSRGSRMETIVKAVATAETAP